jgi:hypothetical protein
MWCKTIPHNSEKSSELQVAQVKETTTFQGKRNIMDLCANKFGKLEEMDKIL